MQSLIILILACAAPATRVSQPDTRPASPQESVALAQREVSKAVEELAEAQRKWEAAVMAAAGQLDTIPEVAKAKRAMLDAERELSATSSRNEPVEYDAASEAVARTTIRYFQLVFANAGRLKADEGVKRADEARNKAVKRLVHAKSVEMELRKTVEVAR